ncbi:hypothetical protein BD289DRAFT_118285 [Coniella lustricola]|uniref:Uncharacterized protein n=1 Tax=Coniella lustricola TaxID=2025994 RepID=A0A2T3AFY6_9PEZI|nr:hypothetical protein BD289DRAFT_118285 [Coniella lustricola]
MCVCVCVCRAVQPGSKGLNSRGRLSLSLTHTPLKACPRLKRGGKKKRSAEWSTDRLLLFSSLFLAIYHCKSGRSNNYSSGLGCLWPSTWQLCFCVVVVVVVVVVETHSSRCT